MSKPTPLSPWFAILRCDCYGDETFCEWYVQDEDREGWHTDITQARLYNSLQSAFRVAQAVGGYAVVIADEASLKEFRPKGM